MPKRVGAECDEKHIKCPCGQVLGTITAVEGFEMIHVGGVVARSIVGFCAACGEQFYWHASDRVLARLINRIVERETSL